MTENKPANDVQTYIFDKPNNELRPPWLLKPTWNQLVVGDCRPLPHLISSMHRSHPALCAYVRPCVCVCLWLQGEPVKLPREPRPALSSHQSHLALHNRPAALSHIGARDGGCRKREKEVKRRQTRGWHYEVEREDILQRGGGRDSLSGTSR